MARQASPRVARDVRAAIADALTQVSDPRLMLVTITEVELTPDEQSSLEASAAAVRETMAKLD